MHFKVSYVGTLLFFKKNRIVSNMRVFHGVVPHIFGSRDPFYGRQFSQGQGRGDGFRMIQVPYVIVHFISFITITSLHLKSSGIRSWRWGTSGLYHTLRPEVKSGLEST